MPAAGHSFLTLLSLQTDDQEVIHFLLTTEIIPLCLRIMESGSELSKTVATFILQKILLDETGLAYICQTYERFTHVAMILVSSNCCSWWPLLQQYKVIVCPSLE